MNLWAPGVEAERDTLIVKYPSRTFGRVKVDRSLDFTYEPAAGQYVWQGQVIGVQDCGWSLSLTCVVGDDAFAVGTTEDARQLISDLQAAIDYCSSFDEPKDTARLK